MGTEAVLRSPGFARSGVDFSIVIPTYNRSEHLRDCLRSISQLLYTRSGYEVVVVDDGGDVSLEATVRPFLARLDLTLLRQSNAGPARARNAGAAVARGEYVVFTDDDCRPDPCWLGALARAAEANPGAALGGETRNGLPGNVFSTASQELLHYLYGRVNGDAGDAVFITSNNLALPRKRFEEIGGFDEVFPLAAAEDRDLCHRWRWRGGRIVYVREAIVVHQHRLDFGRFLKQHFDYGRGAVTFHRLKGRRAGAPRERRYRGFYVLLLAHPFAKGCSRPTSVALLLAASQVMNVLGYFVALASGPRWRPAPSGRLDRWRFRWRRARLDTFFRPPVALASALVLWLRSLALRPAAPERATRLLCHAHRSLLKGGARGGLAGRLEVIVERGLRDACVTGLDLDPLYEPAFELLPSTAGLVGIVLKDPVVDGGRVTERGVLLLKNTDRIDAFRRAVDVGAVLERYALVLEPSWSGYADPAILAYTRFAAHPIVVMAPCREDHDFLERLDLNLRPIAIGASDWVDPRVFVPLPGVAKEFDAVLVARWTVEKRHHVLLRALRQIGDPTFRVALAAGYAAEGPDRAAIRDLIARSGVAGQITIFEDLEPAELNVLLNRSRVNVLLSLQEGSNRALFEGFLAGVPGLALARNVGIPRGHFTPQTGRLIAERRLASTLLEFREGWRAFDPRPWALANIAPERSTHELERVLRDLAAARGEPWTRGLVAKCNVPELRYYPDESAGRHLEPIAALLAGSGAPFSHEPAAVRPSAR